MLFFTQACDKSYTLPQRITTLANGQVAGIICGQVPVIDLTNQNLIDRLSVNDVVMAGDFAVVLISVSGDQNGWSGEAWTKVKWLGDTKIKLKYKGIKVNTDKRLVGAGYFETTYDPSGKNIADVDKVIKDIEDLFNGIKNLLHKVMNSNDPVKFKTTIDSLKNSTADKLGNNTDDATKELINKKFDEMKNIADNTPLNTPANKEAASNKIDEIERLAKNNVKDTRAIDKKEKKKKCYYEIAGNKFHNGDTIFMPKSNKKYEVNGYKAANKPVDSKSVWTGFGAKIDSAKYIYKPATVSQDIKGSILSTIFTRDSIYRVTKKDKTIDSLVKVQDTLRCRMVVVDVKFSEAPNQQWGFDENNPATENDYPSFNTSPAKGIKWKSVNSNGVSDYLVVNVLPKGAEKKVYFTLSDSLNFKVTPKKPIATQQTIAVSGTLDNAECSLIPRIGYFINDTLQVKIVSRRMIKSYARIIIVNESNDDVQEVPINAMTDSDTTVVISHGNNKFLDSRRGIDIRGDDKVIYRRWIRDSVVIAGKNKKCESRAYSTDQLTTPISATQLQSTLNRYYAQALYSWSVAPQIVTKTINFDIDRDGKINVATWANNETNIIYNKCIPIVKDTFNIVVIDNPNDGSNGMSSYLTGICFVHPNISPYIYLTVTHELGHGQFDLKHPFEEFRNFPKGEKDIFNIMNYGNIRNRFRKYQWDKINK